MLCIHIAREKKEKYEKKKNDLRLSSTIQHNCKVWNCIIAQRTPNAIYNEKKKLKKKEKKTATSAARIVPHRKQFEKHTQLVRSSVHAWS